MDAKGTVIWNFFPDQCRHCLTPVCKDVADMSVPRRHHQGSQDRRGADYGKIRPAQ